MLLTRFQILLLCLVLSSAMAVVGVRHQYRLVFMQQQVQEQQRAELQAETGRLILERATWARQHSMEDQARERRDMLAPPPENIVTLLLMDQGEPAP